MGDEEAYCVNILWQISSYIAASEKVASLAWSTVQGLTTFTLDLHARVHALEDVTVEEVELLGAARPAQDPELECVRVHGVHSALLVADLFAKK
jgi:hypothetical protein